MAGNIDKKKNELVGELEGTPATMVGARAGILSDITLSREFADTFLAAICQNFTPGNYSLSVICENLALQRAICYGARAIKNTVKKFDFPPVTGEGTVNGALGLTEPTTSTMGIKATDIGETYPITLSTTAGTQTQGSNTFSVYVDDYYLVRSRVSGELEDVSGNLSAYTTPDGGDIVFGNAVVWVAGTSSVPGGGDVSGELEANTWNYHWATANLTSVVTNNSGDFDEITVLTLTDALTPGSNSANYTPLGPGFGNKFYLKRKTDFVNTFTITGTTTINTVEITGVSETDIAKVKYGDEISGTGIPSGTITIAAVQPAKSQLRLSETAIADGTVTLTIDSVPFGYQAHDIFCQIEIVAEGLVTNDDWEPVGDGAGNYDNDGTTPSETDRGADNALVASTSEFIGLLGFFNPASASTNELTKAASAAWTSDGKEYGGTSYPDIERNPFKPSNGGTNKAYVPGDVALKGITGTQAGGLTDKDIWSGRYIRFDFERADADGDLPEFRYITDSCEKFYYELPATSGYGCGTVTVAAFGSLPSATEPPITILKTGLADCKDAINDSTSIVIPTQASPLISTITAALGSSPNYVDIPADTNTDDLDPDSGDGNSMGGGSWDNNPPYAHNTPTVYASYYTLAGNYVVKNDKIATLDIDGNGSANGHSWTSSLTTAKSYAQCSYNFAQRLMYDKGGSGITSANTNNKFIANTVEDLKGLKSFRDPITTGTAASGTTGITDVNFDDYLADVGSTSRNAWETSHDAFDSYLTGLRNTLAGQISAGTRAGNDNGGTNLGAPISYSDAKRGDWTANNTGVVAAAAKRVIEIDARIGVPGKTGGGAAAGAFPTGRITSIPSSGVDGALVPYGRSLYNSVNHMLGQDVDLLGGIIKDIESLTDLVDMVKTARNKYEIFSGNDKEYT